MTAPPRVIVVSPRPEFAATVTCGLRTTCEVLVVTDFRGARAALARETPDLLITDLRLGAYNGLHLAIIARHRDTSISAVVVGPPDPVLEAEARRQHVVYMSDPDAQGVLAAAACLLAKPTHDARPA